VSCLPHNPLNVVQPTRMAIIVSWCKEGLAGRIRYEKRGRAGKVCKRRATQVLCVAVEGQVFVEEP